MKDVKTYLSSESLQFLMEIIAQHHAVQWMKGDSKQALKTERLIGDLKKYYEYLGESDIFHKIFVPYDGTEET